MRSAGFRCALGARVLKKIPVNKGGKKNKSDRRNRGIRRDRSDKNSCSSCLSCFSCFSSRAPRARSRLTAGSWHLSLLFLCATKLRKVLCHFWWQKWRKSHAPHLWRRRESQSLKRMLRRQSVCRLRFLTALRLSSAATDESVASPPTMRSAGFRCATGAGIKKDTQEN